jgi:hypothetical protein
MGSDSAAMKFIQIIDRKTKRVVAAVPISPGETDSIVMAQQYETKAWKIAVEDEMVDPERRADYSFKIVETNS